MFIININRSEINSNEQFLECHCNYLLWLNIKFSTIKWVLWYWLCSSNEIWWNKYNADTLFKIEKEDETGSWEGNNSKEKLTNTTAAAKRGFGSTIFKSTQDFLFSNVTVTHQQKFKEVIVLFFLTRLCCAGLTCSHNISVLQTLSILQAKPLCTDRPFNVFCIWDPWTDELFSKESFLQIKPYCTWYESSFARQQCFPIIVFRRWLLYFQAKS